MPSSELSWMERNNISPMKAGLVGLLAFVFLGVFAYQIGPLFFRGTSHPVANAKAKEASTERRAREVKKADDSDASAPGAKKFDPNTTWPEIAIQEVIDHDPFRLPAVMRQALLTRSPPKVETAKAELKDEAKQRREQLIAQLAEQGVDIVIFDGQNAVASIGELELRVGDVVEGLLVKNIGREGVEFVVVERSSKEDEP